MYCLPFLSHTHCAGMHSSWLWHSNCPALHLVDFLVSQFSSPFSLLHVSQESNSSSELSPPVFTIKVKNLTRKSSTILTVVYAVACQRCINTMTIAAVELIFVAVFHIKSCDTGKFNFNVNKCKTYLPQAKCPSSEQSEQEHRSSHTCTLSMHIEESWHLNWWAGQAITD